MESVNTKLRDKAISHEIYLQRHYASVSKQIRDSLKIIEKDLVAQIKSLDLDSAMSIKQIDTQLESVKAILHEGYRLAGEELTSHMNDAGEYEQEWQEKTIAAIVPIVLTLRVLNPDAVFAAIESKPLQGKFIKEWVDKLNADSFARIQDAVRMGLVEGEEYKDVVKRVTGAKTLQYTDGVNALNARQTQAVVLTAMAHATNTAREVFYNENKDLIKGVQWVSVLDGRTTLICKSRDGKIYPVNSGVRPPAHFRCRSTTVPIIRAWDEMGTKEPSQGTRASMSGEVADTETYQTWLAKQSHDFQDEVLGKARANLYRAGTPIDHFVDSSGNTYTLKQLKAKEA